VDGGVDNIKVIIAKNYEVDFSKATPFNLDE